MQRIRQIFNIFTQYASKPANTSAINYLDSLPVELQVHLSEFLTPTELNTLSGVNKAAQANYRLDDYWKKRVVSLGPFTQGAYYGQFWQKSSVVKQKAKLLADTFLTAPPGFQGFDYGGFDFFYQEFMDFAPSHLAEHVFNDSNINPLAIIDYAFTFLELTPDSFCPLDRKNNASTLLHTLANIGMPKLLNEYIKKYKDRLDIDFGLGLYESNYSSPLAYALDYMSSSETYAPEAALVLLSHGANIDTEVMEDWLDNILILEEAASIPITDAWRDMLCQFIEKGLVKEKISEVFPDEYAQHRELYEAAERRFRQGAGPHQPANL